MLGQHVRTLVDKQHSAGQFKVTWDGKNTNAKAVPSGLYFCRLEADGFVSSKKMLMLK